MVREALPAYEQMGYLNSRAAGGDRIKFGEAMAKAPNVPPVAGDELPEGWANKH